MSRSRIDFPISRLWTEVAAVFGPSRPTDCFLSIGTGVPPNQKLGELLVRFYEPEASAKRITDFANGIASAASNSEATNVLFSTLLDAYAPNTGQPKYFRLNFEKISETDPNDFEKLAEMDDAKAETLKKQEELTGDWIKANQALIDKAAVSLKRSLT